MTEDQTAFKGMLTQGVSLPLNLEKATEETS